MAIYPAMKKVPADKFAFMSKYFDLEDDPENTFAARAINKYKAKVEERRQSVLNYALDEGKLAELQKMQTLLEANNEDEDSSDPHSQASSLNSSQMLDNDDDEDDV